MNVKIIVEDKDKGTVTIPLTKKLIRDMYDIGYMVDDKNLISTMKMNFVEKSFWKMHKIFAKLVDCYDDGKCYGWKNKKFVPSKHKFWHSGKRPNWVKENNKRKS